jgi:hypothetical protein
MARPDPLALAEQYARMLAARDRGELVVRVGEPLPARIDLVPDEGPWYEVPFDVAIEADGGPVVAGELPIRIAARRVRLAGLVLGGLVGERLQLVAGERVEIERCALVRLPDPRPLPGAIVRVARAEAPPEVVVRGCLLHAPDPDADAAVLRIETPGPVPVDVLVEDCDLGDGLQVDVEGALAVRVRGSRVAGKLRCRPGEVTFESPRDDAPPVTAELARLLARGP